LASCCLPAGPHSPHPHPHPRRATRDRSIIHAPSALLRFFRPPPSGHPPQANKNKRRRAVQPCHIKPGKKRSPRASANKPRRRRFSSPPLRLVPGEVRPCRLGLPATATPPPGRRDHIHSTHSARLTHVIIPSSPPRASVRSLSRRQHHRFVSLRCVSPSPPPPQRHSCRGAPRARGFERGFSPAFSADRSVGRSADRGGGGGARRGRGGPGGQP
jgi:hypothetical protein